MYSEARPNIERIRAAAQLIAERLGFDANVNDEGEYCWIPLPCHDEALIQISEVDAGLAPLIACVVLEKTMKCFYSVSYGESGDFADAVAEYVRPYLGRQIRVTREKKLFGGVFTKTEYLEDGEWRLLSEESDKSFITRFLCLSSKTTVNEYDFRII